MDLSPAPSLAKGRGFLIFEGASAPSSFPVKGYEWRVLPEKVIPTLVILNEMKNLGWGWCIIIAPPPPGFQLSLE
jgi:hypothetical protein